jgi:hypothetical protein
MQRRRFNKFLSSPVQSSNDDDGTKQDSAEAKQEDADAQAMKWAMSPGLQPPKLTRV